MASLWTLKLETLAKEAGLSKRDWKAFLTWLSTRMDWRVSPTPDMEAQVLDRVRQLVREFYTWKSDRELEVKRPLLPLNRITGKRRLSPKRR